MTSKVLAVMALMCLLLFCAVAFDSAPAFAADGLDDMASKESGTLGNKEWDQTQLPGKKEIGMAIGSIFVMIAVVKWL